MRFDSLAAVSEEDRQKGLSRDQIQEIKIFVVQCGSNPTPQACLSLHMILQEGCTGLDLTAGSADMQTSRTSLRPHRTLYDSGDLHTHW